MCRPSTKDEAVLKNLDAEYQGILMRAQGNNQSEASNEEMGSPWWVEDRRGGR